MYGIITKFYKQFFFYLSFYLIAFLALPVGAEVVVQVMSVQDEAAARKEASRLFNLGVSAFSRTEELEDKGAWSRVYLGPFDTTDDAAATAETLKKNGTIKDFIIKNNYEAVVTPEAFDPLAIAVENPEEVVTVPAPVATNVTDLPTAPARLPLAEISTYSKPVDQDQPQELDLSQPSSVHPPLSVYGQESPPVVAESQPPLYGNIETKQPQLGTATRPKGLTPNDNLPDPISYSTTVPASKSNLKTTAPELTSTLPTAATGLRLQSTPIAGDNNLYTLSKKRTSHLAGFDFLVDLSSSMRRMSACQGRIREEAIAHLIRKMNHRIPNLPYNAAMRSFGYKHALTRTDFTALSYGLTTYNRDDFEAAVSRLTAADSVSPFADAIGEADNELQNLGSPKAVLMFSDFEISIGSGNPVRKAEDLRRRYDPSLTIYTFYVTRQLEAERLAKSIAQAGNGKAWEICSLLNNETEFEDMMMTIFGPADTAPCPDSDGDGVCDANDICNNTPRGAPVDERGCWIATYAQFFDFDKDIVKSEFKSRLQHAADLIKNNPSLPRIIIAGHTDNIGRFEYNQELGRRRAQAVLNLLLKYGVSPDRLSLVSFGDQKPVAPNNTEENRARNRRVEFHVGDVSVYTK
ncbi:MAG: hypothetical protein AMR96_04025 [Candidatus Adiutrix intracellularis]|nr:MAG: hypothetical protein AMR96_04025 [Candidatus Adiutrix intracellularis]